MTWHFDPIALICRLMAVWLVAITFDLTFGQSAIVLLALILSQIEVRYRAHKRTSHLPH